MFALGIPERQYRRTTQVLGPYMSTPTNYDAIKQDDGFIFLHSQMQMKMSLET